MFDCKKTGKILKDLNGYFAEDFRKLRLSRQITLGYIIMFFLMVCISGFSIYSIYKLDKAASNIEGRYNTLSSLISKRDGNAQEYFSNEMLTDAIRIAKEQVKYSYVSAITVVFAVLMFGGIITLTVPRLISRPILHLVDVSKRVAAGDFSRRVESIKGSSEITELVRAFNNMLESIEYHEKELERKNRENLRLLEETRRFNEVLEARIEEATREIKEKQEELIKSARLATIGELATGIAHEIRNPLAGIAIALELMRNEIDSEEHKQTIADILKEIERLERIVKELLQLGQPRSLNLIECSPNEIVERALSLVSMKAKEKGIVIEKELLSDGLFYVDPEQIEQVLINLLINGIEAINGFPGKITVRTEDSGDFICISVIDNGCGFSEEERDKIFQPFYSTKEGGTGLGLSISNRIVELHGGRIEVSGSKGKGSVFRVFLPKNLAAEEDRVKEARVL